MFQSQKGTSLGLEHEHSPFYSLLVTEEKRNVAQQAGGLGQQSGDDNIRYMVETTALIDRERETHGGISSFHQPLRLRSIPLVPIAPAGPSTPCHIGARQSLQLAGRP
jgi:hypothetical protein